MTDLIANLRAFAECRHDDHSVAAEAADRIAELEAENAKLVDIRDMVQHCKALDGNDQLECFMQSAVTAFNDRDELWAENARLRAAVATARRKALEAAAERAASALQDWADSLATTRDDYMIAARTGTFNGRRIQPDFAKRAALDFHERSCAVGDTVEMVKTAICAMMEGEG